MNILDWNRRRTIVAQGTNGSVKIIAGNSLVICDSSGGFTTSVVRMAYRHAPDKWQIADRALGACYFLFPTFREVKAPTSLYRRDEIKSPNGELVSTEQALEAINGWNLAVDKTENVGSRHAVAEAFGSSSWLSTMCRLRKRGENIHSAPAAAISLGIS